MGLRPEKAAEALEMPDTEASTEAAEEQPKVKTQEDIDREWQEGIDKMFAFIQESVDYDDEDPVCLDNLGQAYYRVTGEKDKAKEWFEKAHAEKDSQIDTLWFLGKKCISTRIWPSPPQASQRPPRTLKLKRPGL